MDEMGRGIKPLPFGARSKNRAAGHRPGPLLPPASHMGFFSRTLRLHNSPTKFPKLAGQRDPFRRSYGRFPQILYLINIKKYVIIKKKTFLIRAHLKTLKIFVII